MPEISEEELNKLKAAAAQAESASKAADDFKKDMLTYKDRAAANEAELKKLKDAGTEAERKRLAEQGEYKAIAEQEKTAREKAEAERQKAIEESEKSLLSVDRFLKLTKVEAAAQASGLLPTAVADLRLMSLDKLSIRRGTDNNVEVLGVEEFLAGLKKDRPHYFGSGNPPQFNAGGGAGGGNGGGGKELSADDLLKLKKEKPAEYQAYMKERMSLVQAGLNAKK